MDNFNWNYVDKDTGDEKTFWVFYSCSVLYHDEMLIIGGSRNNRLAAKVEKCGLTILQTDIPENIQQAACTVTGNLIWICGVEAKPERCLSWNKVENNFQYRNETNYGYVL